MKIKTFILTFLIMSCPFLFGQSHWVDPTLPGEDVMTVTAKVTLNDELQSGESYEVAVFNGDKLVEVGTFTNHDIPELAYHVGLTIPGEIGDKFYFKFFNGTYEYVSLTEIDYADQHGSHLNLFTIEFKSVAQIEGTEYDVVYSSLQDAIDAAKNRDEITLLQANAENVTVVQAPDVAFTIDGAENTMTGTITVNGKSAAYATAGLTIKNVNFDATNISKDASINLGGSNETRYTNGVTVENCVFTGDWATTGEEKGAIKNYTGGCKNLTINNCTANSLHSLAQLKGVENLTVSGVTVTDCKNGVAVGTSTNVAISGSNISATGYGVRADGEGAYTMTLTDNTISAELPVVVRKAKAAYELTIGEGNTFTAKQQGNNPEGYQVVFTNGDDGTYEAPEGIFTLNVAEGTDLNVYPIYVAELNGKKYITFDEAYNKATTGDVINLLRTVVLDDSKMWWNYSTKDITVKANFGDVAFRVQSGNSMVWFGKMTIESNDYCIIVGSSDGSISANVDIYGGTYKGATTAISVTKGNVNILDGTFQVEPYQGSYEYTINCIDANYNNGTAEVSIKGGKFYNFNPQNNAAEGAGTDFLTAKYAAVQDAEGWYTVVPAVAMIEYEDSKDKYYATLQDAIDAATEGQTVVLINDITIETDHTDGAYGYFKVNADDKIIIDLNGKNITATESATGNFLLFSNYGELTLNDSQESAVVELTATVDRDWNAQSTIVLNRGGVLNINGGKYVHKGGTDMAITICNSANSFGPAYLYVNGGEIISENYIGVRMRMENPAANGNPGNDISYMYVTDGYIYGLNRGIWGQKSSGANEKQGELVVTGGTIENATEGRGAIQFDTDSYEAQNVVATISGDAFIKGQVIAGKDEMSITGGTFTTDVTEYCAFGYACQANGDGTYGIVETTSFEIPNLDRLIAFRNAVNAGNNFKNQTVTVTADINMESVANWTPIGTSANSFQGTFDGGNFTISNLKVNAPETSNVGLFGSINNGATIKNVTIYNATVKGKTQVGAIAGNLHTSTMDNCHVTGLVQIDGNYKVGGLVGTAYSSVRNSSLIADDNSYVKGTHVEADLEGDNVGGITGYNGEGVYTYSNNTVKNVTISGTRKVGGILGFIFEDAKVEGSVVENVTIESTSTSEYAQANAGKMSIGGIIGQYQTHGNNNGYVNTSVVKNVTFVNNSGIDFQVGPLVGGTRNNEGFVPSATVTSEGNAVYMTTIIGSNNLFLMKAVAKIEETDYYTLDEAIAAANNQTVTVLENVELRNTLTIEAGKTVTLDLNGKVVSGVSTTAASSSVITNNGNLTVQSSVEGGKITSFANNPDQNGTPAYANNTITNCGVLTLVSGTIENSTVQGLACYPIDNNSTLRDAIVNIQGGVVTGRGAIRQFANSETNKNEVNVTNGQVIGTSYAIWMQNPSNQNSKDVKAALNISNGELGKILLEASAAYDIEISGGTISEVTFWETDDINPERNASAFITGGTFSSDPTAYVAEGYVVKQNADGTYGVFLGVAKIEETGAIYGTLQAAVNAATTGQTITLLDDIAENVTIKNKKLTIDGGGFNSTGLISTSITTSYPLTFQNFNIDGAVYFVKTDGGGGNYTFDNCNIKNSTAIIYTNKSTNTVTIKNSTIENCSCAANFVSLNVATFENVTLKDTQYGIHVRNNSEKTIIVNGCDFQTVNPLYIQTNSANKTITFQFEGETDVNNNALALYNYGKLVFTSADAKLVNAEEGLDITTTVEGCVVEYEEGETEGFGTYSVVAANVALYRGEELVKKFATIQDAIDAAQDGDEIVVLEDLTVDKNDAIKLNSYNTFFKVENKTVTIDLNGYDITGDVTGLGISGRVGLVGLFSTNGEGHLTLEDSKGGAEVKIENATETDPVYYLISCFDGNKGSITINGGSYSLNAAQDALIHSAGDECVTINGGNFYLGNIGTSDKGNGHPWIVNVNGSNSGNITINGGTFNDDMNHQAWDMEVYVPETLALRNNGDGTWTVVESVAYVEEKGTLTGSAYHKVGYATLAEAFGATEIRNAKDNTVTLVKNITLEEDITVNADQEVVLDLNGKNIDVANDQVNFNIDGKLTLEDAIGTGVFTSRNHFVNEGAEFIVNGGTVQNVATATGGFPINLNGGSVTIKGGTVQAVNNANYAIGGAGGTLVIEGGTVKGNWGAVNLASGSATIANGTLEVTGTTGGHALYVAGNTEVTIEGGEFKPYNGNVASYALVLDEGNPTVNVSGGMFHKEWGCVLVKAGSLSLTGGTFEQDVNAYCAEGFAAVDNDNGTWTVMPSQEQTLVKGWNWYSTYLDIKLNDLTSALGDNGSYIKNSQGNYVENIGDNMWLGDNELTTISPSEMYLVQTTVECNLKLAADLVNPSEHEINLNSEWSWIGYPSNQGVNINVALKDLNAEQGDLIKTLNAYAEYVFGQWLGTLNTMVPGIGYKYHNTSGEAKTFYYNIEATRGAVEANITVENNYWTPNATKYPHNMTMTAVVDGLADGNYEVAAFVNGEVRGSARPIYVEALDTYMFFLTIHGEDVEEMSFRLYDIDNDTEYDLSDRINYSNDAMLGTVNEPYVFSRGTTGIGEAAMSNVNIYPNPTTTGTEINLQATCDKVEVFNALGVKLAEYQNVDTIDALETAGIYVIRITNNGNTQNCRLVVK